MFVCVLWRKGDVMKDRRLVCVQYQIKQEAFVKGAAAFGGSLFGATLIKGDTEHNKVYSSCFCKTKIVY